jgi:hypothetical protein
MGRERLKEGRGIADEVGGGGAKEEGKVGGGGIKIIVKFT